MTNPVRLGFIGCCGHSGRHADVVLKMSRDYQITGAFDLKRDIVDDFIKSRRAYPCYAENRDLKKFLARSEEHTSELQSQSNLLCRFFLLKKTIIFFFFF